MKFKEFTMMLLALNSSMSWLRHLIFRIKMEIAYRKRLKEIRKRDPFIYK